MQDAKRIKENLENLIQNMSKDPSSWAKNPNDFTRNRKLGFNRLLHVMLGMRGNSLNKELYDYFKDSDLMTSSAFVQQRSKLKVNTFKYLLDEFNKISEDDETYQGYKLYAIDGSDFNIATNPEGETYCDFMSDLGFKGYNQFHVNAMYDVLNKTYKDCIVQPKPKQYETKAAWQMIDRTDLEKSIILADRGYGSFNLFEHINRKENVEYLIRVKNGWLNNFKDLPDDEFDINLSFELRNTQIKQDKEDFKIGKAKFLSTTSIWDYTLPYNFGFRVVRFKISDDTYETIITSLNRFEFPISKIKELYHLRWGIETSFRELKYTIGLVNFHAKKEEFILQEIYARLVIYNFCERITNSAVIKQDKKKKTYLSS